MSIQIMREASLARAKQVNEHLHRAAESGAFLNLIEADRARVDKLQASLVNQLIKVIENMDSEVTIKALLTMSDELEKAIIDAERL